MTKKFSYSGPFPVDLRSDTVTRPTPEMRRAMAEAEVGDDVHREDPTVRRLEEMAAGLMGKEAALFVPSGTMGNQIAIKIYTRHGQEVICDSRSHIFNFEMGMMAAFAGCQAFPIPTEDGLPAWEQVSQSLRPRDYDYSRNRLIVLENTHNMAGGRAYPPQRLQEFCDQAHSHGLVVHLDGARIFNAAACLQCAVKEIAAPFDSVMFCLSKGLGAPVGSILAGSSGFIEEALRVRKMLGGGMRQAGVLAAAGLVALEKHPPKLFADHRNARSLAETVSRIPGVLINLATVQTNIVIFDLSEMGVPAKDFAEESKQHSVLLDPLDDHRVRMVTHLDVDENACAYAGHVITALADEWNARKQKSGPTP